MNESDCERIDIALSGGGTRAALYSGGALIAVQEAVLAGKVEVGAIHAVSGSSLLLARIILASDDRELDGDLEADLQLMRGEVEAIARHGFAPSPAARTATSLAIGMLFFLACWIVFKLGDGPMRLLWLLGLPLALVGGPALYQSLRRSVPFNLRRRGRLKLRWRRRRSERRQSMGQHEWFARDHLHRHSALPTREVRFVCTSLVKRCVKLIDPWSEHPVAKGMKRTASLADCAGASAAVPFYSSAVRVGHDVMVDGGVLDNLGANALIDAYKRLEIGAASRPDRVLVVDSSVRKQSPVQVRDSSKMGREVMAIVAPLVLSVLLLVGAALSNLLWRWYLLDVALVLSSVAANAHYMTAFGGRELLELFRALHTESSVRDAVMWTHRSNTVRELCEIGAVASLVELTNAWPFASHSDRDRHDLRTRLSAVRGDTAVELVRAGYEQAVGVCGTAEDPATSRWLDDLSSEMSPHGLRRFVGWPWRPMRSAALLVLLGWGYDRYWFNVDSDGDPAVVGG